MNELTDESAARRGKGIFWGVMFACSLLVSTVMGVLLATLATSNGSTAAERGYVIEQQGAVIDSACPLLGDKASSVPQVQEACTRVAQGKPAVPAAEAAAPAQDGAPGVGVAYARQVDRCYVEIGLTDGDQSRFGPFCGATGESGAPGPTGPTGTSGAPGAPGEPGADGQDGDDGVGVATVEANGCMVDIALTDGTTRSVGPFCGPPVPEYTINRPDGSAVHCVRDGGADTAPVYTCQQTRPPAGTATPTETGEILPLPTG